MDRGEEVAVNKTQSSALLAPCRALPPRKGRVRRWCERCARIVERTLDEAVVKYLKDLSRDLERMHT